MARRRRLQFPGAVYHVMSRGNRKLPIFDDDTDRRMFLTTLTESVRRYEVRCLAYCLMANHYHLLLDTPRGNLSMAMRHVNGVYTQNSNRRHRQTGHVFEGRFRSIVVQRESYLRRVGRYIVRNPVRAGLIAEVADWQWSSYGATAGMSNVPHWLAVDWITVAFDTTDVGDAQASYRRYVNDPAPRKSNVNMRSPIVGDATFQAAVSGEWKQLWPDRPLARISDDRARPALSALFDQIEGAGDHRDRAVSLAHETYGYSLTEIAAHLGVSRKVITRALARLATDWQRIAAKRA
jgi:REP element-mobilizing transposase RayT